MSGKYETVIGLEVHIQLATHTKIFCGCGTAFGAEPNTQVCPVCLGLPGSLPVLNKKAFEYAIKVALALGCETQKTVKFDRKNYYYPDLPKNYQISQYDKPFAFRGSVMITLADGRAKKISVTRVHMEEDAGKLLHDPAQPFSYVDLNRTGMPLLEIVSEPEIGNPEEAHEYLVNLKKIIKYLGVSDCNMEEGSLRCDANVSLREYGAAKLGSKVEIKNMNSFKAVKDALLFEEERQAEMLDDGKIIRQETRLWDQTKGVTQSMRSKEEAHDYRYFPEPDLVPFEVSRELIDAIAKDLPELPAAKEKRFIERYGLDKKDVEVITAERDVADFFESTVKHFDSPRSVSNWVKGEVLRRMNDRATDIKGLGIKSEYLAKVIEMVEKGVISSLAGKDVLEANLDTGKSPEAIVKEKGLEQVSDTGELEGVVEQVIKENARSVSDYQGGKPAALGFLVGQVMKGTKGKANPKIAGDMLRKKLGG